MKVPYLPRLCNGVMCERFFANVLERSDANRSGYDLALLYGLPHYDDDQAETVNEDVDCGSIEDLD